MNDLRELYFEWMYKLVCRGRPSYKCLLHLMDQIDFTYILPMDSNRYDDGTDLRYRFGYEHDIPGPVIATELDSRPCSVLEMMVALSHRLEEQIMDNPDLGDRTGKWFFAMLDNLGLQTQTDNRYDPVYSAQIIDRLLNREYGKDGSGGLFTVRNPRKDMRDVEIWYQAMWYLSQRGE